MACDVCGGNCGQCGTSEDRDVPPSMDQMIENLYASKKQPSATWISQIGAKTKKLVHLFGPKQQESKR